MFEVKHGQISGHIAINKNDFIRQGCASRKSFLSFTGCYYITAGGHPYFIDFILKKPFQLSTAQPHLTRQLYLVTDATNLTFQNIFS